MRNRAKCKLCKSVIESKFRNDYVTCKCGEISIDGGEEMQRCMARDFNNLCYIDDEGNEINIKTKDANDSKPPTFEELLGMLNEMIKNLEQLPSNAMLTPITHYDLVSSLILINALFRSKANVK